MIAPVVLDNILTPLYYGLKYVKSKPFQYLLQTYIIEPQESNDKTDNLHEDGNISIDYIIRYINGLFMNGLSSFFEDEDDEDDDEVARNDILYDKLNDTLTNIQSRLEDLQSLGMESIEIN